MKQNRYILIIILSVFASMASGQDKPKAKVKSDSTDLKSSDRNVMLNAANNTGPRDVNIGLPASTGGTTVLENGIPTVFFYWPELPPKAWRNDASIAKSRLLNLGETAVRASEVGLSLSTFNNLGTEKLQVKGALNSNHFGLLRGDFNASGPLNKKGLKFSMGAYGSFDPGSFTPKGLPKYYSDQAQLYKAALTQDYKFEGGKGSISAFYKYAHVDGINIKYSPFRYVKNGKIEEIEGFKAGTDSYIESSGKVVLRDAYTGKIVENDPLKDYGSESHTFDIIGKNTLASGLNIDFIVRYRHAETGMYNTMMGAVAKSKGNFTYADNPSEVYKGSDAQAVLVLASRKTPMKTLMGTFEVGKQSGKHKWSVGLDQWYFSTDNFITESSQYYQEIANNPRKLKLSGQDADMAFNKSLEYYNGRENKSAIFLLDKWRVSDVLTLDMGARLQYFGLRGDYIAAKDRKTMTTVDLAPKTDIKHDWLTKSLMVSAVFKITDKFGALGEAVYNEDGAHLNKYSTGNNPDIKLSQVPEAAVGVFFNHKLFSLVSKATYINRNNYRTTTNFSNPNNAAETARPMTAYDVETIGWTTDILATPIKNFQLHFLLTLQQPKYKNFEGKVAFNDGTVIPYDFSGKIVTGVPKVLIEIDPSYKWNNLRIWGSARYFSKQYFNKPNTLYLEGRWETFAGGSYKINKNLDINVTFVNLLNQRGVSGSLPQADLVTTDEQVKEKEGTIMGGTYIRPFTTEFGLKYKF